MGRRIVLRQPSEVRQTSTATCWAAALESWLLVCQRGARKWQGETDLIAKFKKYASNAPALSLYNGTSIDGLRKIAQDASVAMAHKTLIHIHLGIGTPSAGIDPAEFESRLRKHGHLFVVYPVTGGAHANVVYGLDSLCDARNPILQVMDPGRGYQTKPFAALAMLSPVFLGWPT